MESAHASKGKTSPKVGVDYPRTYAEFMAWFADDAACVDYLDWLRWKDGFECPTCHGSKGWRMKNGKWWCEACRNRVSSTAGTIFHRTKTPLTVWFAAAWHVTFAKNGVSAKTLHRILGFGSYQTAWAMLHRFRCAISNAGHDMLAGHVEVDETVFGGVRHGKRGRGAGGKVLVKDHLQAYLDEFAFRFNRRKSSHRGMLFFRLIEQCVAMHPMPFHELVANPRPKQFVAPPIRINKSPASLDISVPSHPWRKVLP